MSHLKKYKTFYEENKLIYSIDSLGMPIADGIDCLCDNLKGCGNSCHSGIPCKLFKPNSRFYKAQDRIGIKSEGIDYEKDYFERQKSTQDLKIEELEARLTELESQRMEVTK